LGYDLEAVIGPVTVLRPLVTGLALLPHGLALLPMTDEVFDAAVPDPAADRGLGFWKLPPGYEKHLAAWSAAGPVGYCEAEYFGGAGSQRAALWENGELTFGPVTWEEGEPMPAAGSPISQLLRRLGVTRQDPHDEFDAVGLDRHRHTEDWPTG
jgi:hypothetical protein